MACPSISSRRVVRSTTAGIRSVAVAAGRANGQRLRHEPGACVLASAVRIPGQSCGEHLGLILNVFDRDHDGWGGVLLEQGGYESMHLSVLEYSPTGFQPAGIEYGFGC